MLNMDVTVTVNVSRLFVGISETGMLLNTHLGLLPAVVAA